MLADVEFETKIKSQAQGQNFLGGGSATPNGPSEETGNFG